MKRLFLILACCAAAILLTACGTKKATPAVEAPQATEAPASETAMLPAAPAAQTVATSEGAAIDLDLTKISGTVVYSQVYDMMTQPDAYMGQVIRVKGSFSYFQDPQTRQEYFAVIIADAAACCAQGIEFVWEGDHAYPQDYPPLDSEITVTGTFNTYYEGENMYVQLTDADVTWAGA